MATKAESNVVYAAGLVQGIALVTFPAVSTILTDPAQYDLSSTQYGAMFLPQVVLAIIASLTGARLAGRTGTKRLYIVGLATNLAAMVLLSVSQFFVDEQAVAYGILLAATTCLGAGFGLTVPALNTFTADFHPSRVDRSVLSLNALLGLGTALAPVFVAIFVGLGFWWGLPVLTAGLLGGLLLVSVRLPLQTSPATAGASATAGIPPRFWLFAAFAVLYGIAETMNGNWSQLDMTQDVGASTVEASLALTAFWSMVTIGRVTFAMLERRFPTSRTYRLLPFVLAAAFIAIALLPDDAPWLGVLAFAIAGLGCSALLPLTISFGQEQLVTISASVAGGVIACYQFGYGIAALGTGPLLDANVDLPTLFGATSVVAATMGLLAFILTRRAASPSPRTASS